MCPALADGLPTTAPPGKPWPNIMWPFVTGLFSMMFSRFIYVCFLFFYKFIYLFLFLAVLGLLCCARAFSGCGEWGLLFVVVRRLLIVVASQVVEHGL